MKLEIEFGAPEFPLSNENIAHTAKALSFWPRLSIFLLIDVKADEHLGMPESKIKSSITKLGWSTAKLRRDVLYPLDLAFLDKNWGKFLKPKSLYENRWVSTPVGDSIASAFRNQLGDTPKRPELRMTSNHFDVLGHESRIAIIRTLDHQNMIRREDLIRLVLPRSAIGHHLSTLLKAGVIAIEPDNCKVEQNQLPEVVYPGEKFESYFHRLAIIIRGIENSPDVSNFPIWYFASNLLNLSLSLSSNLVGPAYLASLIGSTPLWKDTGRLNWDDTLKDFLKAGVESAYIVKGNSVLGVVDRKQVIQDAVTSLPVTVGTS